MAALGVVGMIFGALVLVGGVIGYATKASVPSLVAGSGFGIALLVSAWAMLKGKTIGWYVALGLAAIIALYLGNQYWQGGVLMPAGLMAALSLLALVLFVVLPLRTAGCTSYGAAKCS